MNGSGVAARAGSTPAAVATSASTSAGDEVETSGHREASASSADEPPTGSNARIVVGVGRPRGASATCPGGASAPAVAVEPARSGMPPASWAATRRPVATSRTATRSPAASIDEVRARRTAEHGRAGILGQRDPPAGVEVDGIDRAGEPRTGRADHHAAARHAQAPGRCPGSGRPPRSRDRAPGHGMPPSRTTTRRAARPPRAPGPWRTSGPARGPVPARRAGGPPTRRSSGARRRGPPGWSGPRGARGSSARPGP